MATIRENLETFPEEMLGTVPSWELNNRNTQLFCQIQKHQPKPLNKQNIIFKLFTGVLSFEFSPQ